MMAKVDCVWPARAMLGEGPSWDAGNRRVLWVDIKGRRLHAYRPADGKQQSWETPWRMGSIGVAPAGWTQPAHLAGAPYLACGDVGLAWIGVTDDSLCAKPILHPELNLPGNRFNDGKAGPDGRYWAGTMDDREAADSGSLYAFDAEGGCERLDGGYRVPNGPAFSPDGSTVYHSDSARQTVYAFDLAEDGSIRDKRVFARFAPGEGYPDGMTTDAEGDLWIAMWDGARIEHVAADGRRIGTIPIPTARPTSCAIAGEDMYVTSASIGLDADDTLAGGLFRVVGWRG